MSRLSKKQIKAHREAETLLTKERLSDDEREFVLDNWQEGATNINSAAGAFFTPSELALSTVIYASGAERIIDLCAGTGCLGLWAWWHSNRTADVTCVEINPQYVEVGRKIFPEANWVCASLNELPSLGTFDCAIANPPFGRTAKIKGPRYSGEDDLAVVDVASDLARWGVFILPQLSVPFEYSGKAEHRMRPSAKYERFLAKTGIELVCESTDASVSKDKWRGVAPSVEVASAYFEDLQAARTAEMPRDLFSEAA